MISEFLYDNKPIQLNSVYRNGFEEIYLKICVDKLENDQIWDEYFVYKMLKHIEITANSMLLFQTNGMIIKSMIDVFHNKYKQKYYGYVYEKNDLIEISKQPYIFYIPLFMDKIIPLHCEYTSILMDIKLDTYFSDKTTVYVVPKYVSETKKTFDDVIIKTATHQSKLIDVPENIMSITYDLKMDGLIDYLLFYVDNGIEVNTMELDILGVRSKILYADLNILLPYYYLKNMLPSNYLFISFSQNDQCGLNLSRLASVKINFEFKKNNGGNIYLMTNSKNILVASHSTIGYKYSESLTFEEYIWPKNMIKDIDTDADIDIERFIIEI